MTVEVTAEEPAVAEARGRVGRAFGGAFALACALALAYAFFYGGLIWRSDAVPTFDQTAYMNKTEAIAEAIWHRPWEALHPWTYLGEPAANRPPLMMVPAALVLGPGASPQAVAACWMVLRLGLLLLGLVVVDRQLRGDAQAPAPWWMPAALAAILAAPGSLTVYPHMLMMDHAFEAMGLVAFGLLVRDLRMRTARTAAWGAAAGLGLFLIKPAGLVFAFPLGVLLAVRAVQLYRREPHAPVAALRGWLWPYAVGAAVLGLILVSPYGVAVVQQYALGAKGYWHTPGGVLKTVGMLALIFPPWLLALAAAAVVWRGGGDGVGRGEAARVVVGAGLAVAVWWFVFNAFLTYTLDPRIVPAAMPVAVVACAVVVAGRAGMAWVGTVAGVLLLGGAMADAGGVMPEGVRRVANIAAPLPGLQGAVREVGLMNVAMEIRRSVGGEGRAGRVLMVCHDDFVEVDALKLALRYSPGSAEIGVECFPWGATDLELGRTFSRFGWYVTKARRKATPLSGDVWTNMLALDALILDPRSPLAGKFEAVATLPIQQGSFHDTVTLWRLASVPSAEETAAAAAFVLPRYRGTAGEAGMGEQARGVLE